MNVYNQFLKLSEKYKNDNGVFQDIYPLVKDSKVFMFGEAVNDLNMKKVDNDEYLAEDPDKFYDILLPYDLTCFSFKLKGDPLSLFTLERFH